MSAFTYTTMNTSNTQQPRNEEVARKELYRAPHLTIHGALERLTLQSGGSLTGGTGTGGIPADPNGPGNGA